MERLVLVIEAENELVEAIVEMVVAGLLSGTVKVHEMRRKEIGG